MSAEVMQAWAFFCLAIVGSIRQSLRCFLGVSLPPGSSVWVVLAVVFFFALLSAMLERP